MATQTIAAPSAPLQFPQSKPAVETISQEELGLLLSLRGRLKQLESDIATEEESLKTLLAAGAIIEPGDHTSMLKENNRRNVSWKDFAIRLAKPAQDERRSLLRPRPGGNEPHKDRFPRSPLSPKRPV